MARFRIGLYPGDGIGPEVLDQAVRVLAAPASGAAMPDLGGSLTTMQMTDLVIRHLKDDQP